MESISLFSTGAASDVGSADGDDIQREGSDICSFSSDGSLEVIDIANSGSDGSMQSRASIAHKMGIERVEDSVASASVPVSPPIDKSNLSEQGSSPMSNADLSFSSESLDGTQQVEETNSMKAWATRSSTQNHGTASDGNHLDDHVLTTTNKSVSKEMYGKGADVRDGAGATATVRSHNVPSHVSPQDDGFPEDLRASDVHTHTMGPAALHREDSLVCVMPPVEEADEAIDKALRSEAMPLKLVDDSSHPVSSGSEKDTGLQNSDPAYLTCDQYLDASKAECSEDSIADEYSEDFFEDEAADTKKDAIRQQPPNQAKINDANTTAGANSSSLNKKVEDNFDRADRVEVQSSNGEEQSWDGESCDGEGGTRIGNEVDLLDDVPLILDQRQHYRPDRQEHFHQMTTNSGVSETHSSVFNPSDPPFALRHLFTESEHHDSELNLEAPESISNFLRGMNDGSMSWPIWRSLAAKQAIGPLRHRSKAPVPSANTRKENWMSLADAHVDLSALPQQYPSVMPTACGALHSLWLETDQILLSSGSNSTSLNVPRNVQPWKVFRELWRGVSSRWNEDIHPESTHKDKHPMSTIWMLQTAKQSVTMRLLELRKPAPWLTAAVHEMFQVLAILGTVESCQSLKLPHNCSQAESLEALFKPVTACLQLLSTWSKEPNVPTYRTKNSLRAICKIVGCIADFQMHNLTNASGLQQFMAEDFISGRSLYLDKLISKLDSITRAYNRFEKLKKSSNSSCDETSAIVHSQTQNFQDAAVRACLLKFYFLSTDGRSTDILQTAAQECNEMLSCALKASVMDSNLHDASWFAALVRFRELKLELASFQLNTIPLWISLGFSKNHIRKQWEEVSLSSLRHASEYGRPLVSRVIRCISSQAYAKVDAQCSHLKQAHQVFLRRICASRKLTIAGKYDTTVTSVKPSLSIMIQRFILFVSTSGQGLLQSGRLQGASPERNHRSPINVSTSINGEHNIHRIRPRSAQVQTRISNQTRAAPATENSSEHNFIRQRPRSALASTRSHLRAPHSHSQYPVTVAQTLGGRRRQRPNSAQPRRGPGSLRVNMLGQSYGMVDISAVDGKQTSVPMQRKRPSSASALHSNAFRGNRPSLTFIESLYQNRPGYLGSPGKYGGQLDPGKKDFHFASAKLFSGLEDVVDPPLFKQRPWLNSGSNAELRHRIVHKIPSSSHGADQTTLDELQRLLNALLESEAVSGTKKVKSKKEHNSHNQGAVSLTNTAPDPHSTNDLEEFICVDKPKEECIESTRVHMADSEPVTGYVESDYSHTVKHPEPHHSMQSLAEPNLAISHDESFNGNSVRQESFFETQEEGISDSSRSDSVHANDKVTPETSALGSENDVSVEVDQCETPCIVNDGDWLVQRIEDRVDLMIWQDRSHSMLEDAFDYAISEQLLQDAEEFLIDQESQTATICSILDRHIQAAKLHQRNIDLCANDIEKHLCDLACTELVQALCEQLVSEHQMLLDESMARNASQLANDLVAQHTEQITYEVAVDSVKEAHFLYRLEQEVFSEAESIVSCAIHHECHTICQAVLSQRKHLTNIIDGQVSECLKAVLCAVQSDVLSRQQSDLIQHSKSVQQAFCAHTNDDEPVSIAEFSLSTSVSSPLNQCQDLDEQVIFTAGSTVSSIEADVKNSSVAAINFHSSDVNSGKRVNHTDSGDIESVSTSHKAAHGDGGNAIDTGISIAAAIDSATVVESKASVNSTDSTEANDGLAEAEPANDVSATAHLVNDEGSFTIPQAATRDMVSANRHDYDQTLEVVSAAPTADGVENGTIESAQTDVQVINDSAALVIHDMVNSISNDMKNDTAACVKRPDVALDMQSDSDHHDDTTNVARGMMVSVEATDSRSSQHKNQSESGNSLVESSADIAEQSSPTLKEPNIAFQNAREQALKSDSDQSDLLTTTNTSLKQSNVGPELHSEPEGPELQDRNVHSSSPAFHVSRSKPSRLQEILNAVNADELDDVIRALEIQRSLSLSRSAPRGGSQKDPLAPSDHSMAKTENLQNLPSPHKGARASLLSWSSSRRLKTTIGNESDVPLWQSDLEDTEDRTASSKFSYMPLDSAQTFEQMMPKNDLSQLENFTRSDPTQEMLWQSQGSIRSSSDYSLRKSVKTRPVKDSQTSSGNNLGVIVDSYHHKVEWNQPSTMLADDQDLEQDQSLPTSMIDTRKQVHERNAYDASAEEGISGYESEASPPLIERAKRGQHSFPLHIQDDMQYPHRLSSKTTTPPHLQRDIRNGIRLEKSKASSRSRRPPSAKKRAAALARRTQTEQGSHENTTSETNSGSGIRRSRQEPSNVLEGPIHSGDKNQSKGTSKSRTLELVPPNQQTHLQSSDSNLQPLNASQPLQVFMDSKGALFLQQTPMSTASSTVAKRSFQTTDSSESFRAAQVLDDRYDMLEDSMSSESDVSQILDFGSGSHDPLYPGQLG